MGLLIALGATIVPAALENEFERGYDFRKEHGHDTITHDTLFRALI